MSEEAEYIVDQQELIDAGEMLGAGYDHPSIEIEAPSTVIRRRGREFIEEDKPAFIKFSTGFKSELAEIDEIAHGGVAS